MYAEIILYRSISDWLYKSKRKSFMNDRCKSFWRQDKRKFMNVHIDLPVKIDFVQSAEFWREWLFLQGLANYISI